MTPDEHFITFADLAEDDWAVMRDLLPASAETPLLLAARDAADRLLLRIIKAEHRAGLSAASAQLLDHARASIIGRIAQLDNWRGQLNGTAFIPYPRGEDTAYARAMRLRPDVLAKVIAAI